MTTRERWRRGLIAVGLAALLSIASTACTGDDEPAAGSRDDGVSVTGYAGLYYDPSLVSVLPGAADQLLLVAGTTCTDLDAMLSAGQWRVVDRISLPPAMASLSAMAGVVPGVLLQRGDAMAFVAFRGERDFCRGTVTPVQHDGIAVTGDGLPGSSPGWAVTTSCIRTDENSLTVSVYFDTSAKLGGLVTAPLHAEAGKSTVDGTNNDLALRLLGHPSHVLEVFGTAFATGVVAPGVTPHILEPGEAFASTVTLADGSSDRPHGTFAMTGLVDPESGAAVGVTLPFACPSVLVIKSD